jgi:predicted transcriptional regulator
MQRLARIMVFSIILNMPNMSNSTLTAEQGLFIEDLAALLMGWNMARATARLYSYLLIRNEPASLDDIAVDLEFSRTTACVAAKDLEQQGNARRLRERGTKRVLYVIADDPGVPLYKQLSLLGLMAELIEDRTAGVATGEVADRMLGLAKFHRDLRGAMKAVVMPS